MTKVLSAEAPNQLATGSDFLERLNDEPVVGEVTFRSVAGDITGPVSDFEDLLEDVLLAEFVGDALESSVPATDGVVPRDRAAFPGETVDRTFEVSHFGLYEDADVLTYVVEQLDAGEGVPDDAVRKRIP